MELHSSATNFSLRFLMSWKILEITSQIDQQFSQNAEYFLFFQYSQLVSHPRSLKFEKKKTWMRANKEINVQIYQKWQLKAGEVQKEFDKDGL